MAHPPRTFQDLLLLPRVRFVDRGLLPAVSGIYFALFDAGTPRLAYLGKAENIRMRWTGHHRESDLELLTALGLAVELAWCEVPEPLLSSTEEELIRLFGPPLNQRYQRRARHGRLKYAGSMQTAAETVQDYRVRREAAVALLEDDAFWNATNADDGDLFCVWPFPDGKAGLVNVNEIWMYRDSHPINPSRIPTPPAFEANNSGWVEPAKDFAATAAERRDWIFEVAYQVDAWLVAVAEYHGSVAPKGVLTEVRTALLKEKRVTDLLSLT